MTQTYFETRESGLKDRKWHLIDAQDVPLGRLASQVASLIRGKHNVKFAPHSDNGDFVLVLNASKVKLTGNKLAKKLYRDYTGFIGGLKETPAGSMLEKHPEDVIRRAVQGMLPSGPLGFRLIQKLKVFAGTEHPHAAQTPQPYKLNS